MRAGWTVGFFISAILAWPGITGAHDSLYHYIEARIGDGAAVEVTFSVHAADLAAARALGADPAGNDLEWLRGRTADEVNRVLAEAKAFVTATFSLEVDGKAVDLPTSLRFSAPDRLASNPTENESARPGFIEGTLFLPAGTSVVVVGHAATSGKRLLFVENRPRAFPLIKDLAPGESATLALNP